MPKVELPDFDVMEDLGVRVAQAKARMVALERMIDIFGASYMQEALHNRNLWTNGSKPSMTVLSNIYRKVGLTHEHRVQMELLVKELADETGKYWEAKEQLQTCRDRIEVWRSQNANARKGFI